MNTEYKEQHEQFVSGSEGTTCEEVLLLSFVSVLTAFLIDKSVKVKHFWLSVAVSSNYLVTPLILTSTLLSDHVPTVITILSVLMALKIAISIHLKKTKIVPKKELDHHIKCFTQFRSQLLLATSIAILAVDFKIYPRRFGKTESFGWGCMDVGVGSFVLAAGLVSKEARNVVPSKIEHITTTIKSCTIMLILGAVRILATSSVNYHEHVTEYGTHWNFFLTFAFTKIISTCFLVLFSVKSAFILSTIIITVYQISLSNTELTNFILNQNRENLFYANKEGIVSLTGYISLYLYAICLGFILRKIRRKKMAIWFLLLTGVICHALMYIAHYNIQPVSRRLVNLAYILWILSLSCFHLSFNIICEWIEPNKNIVLEAINRYGLVYFLISNLLTGLINLSLNTIHASAFTGIVILYFYINLLTLVVCALQKHRIHVGLNLFHGKLKKGLC